MKFKFLSTLFVVFHISAIGILGYLNTKHIELKTGSMTQASSCNISSKFNCDAVSASSYSDFLGVSISTWGMVSLVISLLLFSTFLLFKSGAAYHYARLLTYINTSVCIIYAIISTFLLSTYCLYCIASYVLILLSAICIYQLKENVDKVSLSRLIQDLFQDKKAYLVYFLAIPLLSFILNQSLLGEAYSKVKTNAKFALQAWQQSPKKDFPKMQEAVYGDSKPIMTILEFADFNCIHCKHAAPVLHAFVGGNPGVQLRFFHFPLDGNCNDAIERAGASCEMAKAVFCAHQIGDTGWMAQEEMFAQKRPVSKAEAIDLVVKTAALPKEDLITCMEDPNTLEVIKAQAKLGEDSGVRGTPSIFVNGKILPNGQMLPVLKEVYKYLQTNRGK